VSRAPIVVIGVGNEWRSDDAAGLEVARRLREARLPRTRVIEREGEPVDLIDAWSGAGEAIVVDAVSSGAEPGAIHRVDARRQQLPIEAFGGSTHALGLAEAVELGRALERLPEHLFVVGIEGGRFTAGSGLSPEVERAVAQLVRELRRRLGGEGQPSVRA
jgi:hydrogenase maturation protease